MVLTNSILIKLLEDAKKAAMLAGKHILLSKNSDVKIINKGTGENIASQVVTKVDFEAQEIILSNLSFMDQKLGLLTEESEDNFSRFEKDYFWCIDPLDGTLAWTQDEYGFSTSIALVSQTGESLLAVVYEPTKDQLFWALKNNGAFRNDKKLSIENKTSILKVFHDKSFAETKNYQNDIKRIQENIKTAGYQSMELISLGGAVMNALESITSGDSIYYKKPKVNNGGGSLWDFSATSLIHKEANGINSDFSGAAFNFNKKHLFMNDVGVLYASSQNLHNIFKSIF